MSRTDVGLLCSIFIIRTLRHDITNYLSFYTTSSLLGTWRLDATSFAAETR